MILEDGTIEFSTEEQAKVDEIIKERLARVKSEKPSDYDDLKEIEQLLGEFEYSGTPAEKKAALKQQAEQNRAKKELDALEKEAEDYGNSVPKELLKEIKDLRAEIAEIKSKDAAKETENIKKIEAQEKWEKQVKEFNESHEDVDVNELGKNPKFVKFYENSRFTLLEAYNEYLDLVGGAEKEAMAKIKSNIDRSTSSGKAKGEVGGTHGLTPRQMQLADDSGLSYKDYSTAMKLIKK
jgi:chromosome segregation ATPase